jgi:hypothetical protein
MSSTVIVVVLLVLLAIVSVLVWLYLRYEGLYDFAEASDKYYVVQKVDDSTLMLSIPSAENKAAADAALVAAKADKTKEYFILRVKSNLGLVSGETLYEKVLSAGVDSSTVAGSAKSDTALNMKSVLTADSNTATPLKITRDSIKWLAYYPEGGAAKTLSKRLIPVEM